MTTEATTTAPHISDIRTIMAEQLRALRSASPAELESELKRSKAVSELSQTMINSAKVEIDYLQATKQRHSPFLEAPTPTYTGNTPEPQIPNTLGISPRQELKDATYEKPTVTRTTWVDVATKGKGK
jgi:hypothetical protein